MISDSPTMGRPTVITESTLSKLKGILQRGLSIKKACVYAGIGEKTFHRHYNSDSEFRQQIDEARNYATLVASEVVVNDILQNKSVNTSKWWLERKEPEEFNNASITQINTQNNQYNAYQFISQDELKKWAIDNGIDRLNPVAIVQSLDST